RLVARVYEMREGGWRSASPDDRRRAFELLSENLGDDARDTRSLLDWLRVARFANVSLDRVAELLSYSADATRDTLFYDYVIAALSSLQGRESALHDFRAKLERCRER